MASRVGESFDTEVGPPPSSRRSETRVSVPQSAPRADGAPSHPAPLVRSEVLSEVLSEALSAAFAGASSESDAPLDAASGPAMQASNDGDDAPGSGVPVVPSSRNPKASLDPRMLAAWHEWLRALATDAESALAAAHVYGELGPDGRDAWLDALVEDAPQLRVPLVALYAPLLSVEADPLRRMRMAIEMGDEVQAMQGARLTRAVRGVAPDGMRVVSLVRTLYLSFVQVLSCRYNPDDGFVWVKHDPFLREIEAPKDGGTIDGTVVEATPVKPVIEELAHAILAHRRRGAELSSALSAFADLFDAEIDVDPDYVDPDYVGPDGLD